MCRKENKMIDPLKLPKQEEVTEIEMGNGNKIAIIELKDEIALSMYEGDECMYCHRNFTPEEVRESVWAHENEFGRIVHKACWKANN